MPFYRTTTLFRFNGVPNSGFSESYETQFATQAIAAAKWSEAVPKRLAWLSQSWALVGVRVAEVTTVLVSGKCVKRYKPVGMTGCPDPQLGKLGVADTPYTAVYFSFDRETSGRKRVFFARGVPDTWWTNAGLSIPGSDGNKFLQWFDHMRLAQGFGHITALPTGCSMALDKYTQYCLKRIASRRIGRPFGLLRGRRSKRPPVA